MQNDIEVTPWRGPLPDTSHHRAYLAPSAQDGALGTQSVKGEAVLVVEDDLLVARQMEIALAEAGFEVVGIATSGEEALDLAAAQSPALVIMDINLAGERDGIATALELFRTRGIRCIFSTANADEEAQRRAAPADPLGWLQKPYTMASLTAMVGAALDQMRDRRD